MFYDYLSALLIILQPANFLLLIIGMLVGIFVGAAPGLQNTTAMVIFLPFTYSLNQFQSFIVLTGIYVGGVYGGSVTAILFRIPGAPEAAATVFDGYTMNKKGQAPLALGTAISCSSIGGLAGTFALIFSAPLIAKIALAFGPPEYFALVLFALTMVCFMGKSVIKALISMLFGLLFSAIGIGPVSGTPRFTFGFDLLKGGIDFVSLIVGIFAISEVLSRTEVKILSLEKMQEKITSRLLSFKELFKLKYTILRSSIVGIIIGALPALGATVAAFVSYDIEKRFSKNPEKMGTGVVEGIAAPETANNASVGGAIIPLLTLGIPGSASTAVMIAAFQLHGLQPGARLFIDQKELIYVIFVTLIITNLSILLCRFGLVSLMARAVNINFQILGPIIILFCVIGAYTSRNNLFDVWATLLFGILGYFMEKYDFSLPAFVLAFILGPIVEASFLRSMMMFDNNLLLFFTKPIPLCLFFLAFITIIIPVIKRVKKS